MVILVTVVALLDNESAKTGRVCKFGMPTPRLCVSCIIRQGKCSESFQIMSLNHATALTVMGNAKRFGVEKSNQVMLTSSRLSIRLLEWDVHDL